MTFVTLGQRYRQNVAVLPLETVHISVSMYVMISAVACFNSDVPLFPVWVGFAAGVYVYLPRPSCRAAKAHRQVTDTQTGKSRTALLKRAAALVIEPREIPFPVEKHLQLSVTVSHQPPDSQTPLSMYTYTSRL